jgi:hypothetical protein
VDEFLVLQVATYDLDKYKPHPAPMHSDHTHCVLNKFKYKYWARSIQGIVESNFRNI